VELNDVRPADELSVRDAHFEESGGAVGGGIRGQNQRLLRP